MRVLWFTNTPSCYASKGGCVYNGGGWISSLEHEIVKRDDIELAVSFFMDGQPVKVKREHTTYYPIPQRKKKIFDTISILMLRKDVETETWKNYERLFLDVIEDFNPDIIQVFGSEKQFGLVARVTKIPVILHIQGILTLYQDAFLPPFFSWNGWIKQSWNPIKILKSIKRKREWELSVYREKEILRNVAHYIGRTEWDFRAVKLFNPCASYYYGSEILRQEFYENVQRKNPERLVIVTTISFPPYKGFDMVLHTANILKNIVGLNFEWLCFGNINPNYIERHINIHHNDVNVHIMGVATAEELRDVMVNATLYVHTSYIDNSPNSLCESQMIGLPSVVTAVGGVPSLVDDGETGYLVPSNDAYQMAYCIQKLYLNKEKNKEMGTAAKVVAQKRHSKEIIIDELFKTYNEIIGK